MVDDVIRCVFAVDDGYCQHLAVALASLFANNAGNRLDVTIVHGPLGCANRDRLMALLRDHPDVEARFEALDIAGFRHFPQIDHLTLAAYFRLFLPAILPATVKRVLYLDADLVVLGDLRELWDTDLGGQPIAAAPDFTDIHNRRLSLAPETRVFNSGVLLIDLERWRAEGLMSRFVDYVDRFLGILTHCDQDVLNVVLENRVRYLDLTWNYQIWLRYYHVRRWGMARDAFDRVAQCPRIVHYAGGQKPWRYLDDVRHEAAYMRYLQRTPWRSFRQPDRTMRAIARRSLKRSLKRWAPGVLRRIRQARRSGRRVPASEPSR